MAPTIFEGTLSDAFIFADRYYQQYHQSDSAISNILKSNADEYYWEHAEVYDNLEVTKIQLRQDQPINRTRWQFKPRLQYSGFLKRSK